MMIGHGYFLKIYEVVLRSFTLKICFNAPTLQHVTTDRGLEGSTIHNCTGDYTQNMRSEQTNMQ